MFGFGSHTARIYTTSFFQTIKVIWPSFWYYGVMSKRLWLLVGIVIVVVGIVKIVNQPTGSSSTANSQASSASESGAILASSSIVSDISSVPETTLQTIGKGSVTTEPQAISAPALTNGQKPEVFFEGAEYCPYCATERWPMAVALSKFGTFTNLKLSHSSLTDVYPDTHTLSFYGSTYSSQYINFSSVELYSNVPDDGFYTTLQTPTAAEQKLASTYDTSQAIPFIDFGGKYIVSGATYNPALLQGKSWNQIASSLSDSNSTIAKGVDGAANGLIAAICSMTNGQPSNVCSADTTTL